MVSVPDWSRLGRVIDTFKSNTGTKNNKYHRQREADAIKQAEKHGHFLIPTKYVSKVFELFNRSPCSITNI